jgi:hypothetical protein
MFDPGDSGVDAHFSHRFLLLLFLLISLDINAHPLLLPLSFFSCLQGVLVVLVVVTQGGPTLGMMHHRIVLWLRMCQGSMSVIGFFSRKKQLPSVGSLQG